MFAFFSFFIFMFISQNGDRLFVGAPGSWYWQGKLNGIITEFIFFFCSMWKKLFSMKGTKIIDE